MEKTVNSHNTATVQVENVRLRQKVLDSILHSSAIIHGTLPDSSRLLVGNEAKDDAAVYDLEDGIAHYQHHRFFLCLLLMMPLTSEELHPLMR